MYKTVKQKEKEAFNNLKEKFGYKNTMQTPKIVKVVVSSGVGSISDKNKIEKIAEKLSLITGQKASTQQAKKSIAGFKVREGQLSGYKVTLRGDSARNFLDKLINIALPRTRDFRGLKTESIDDIGNYTFGIKDNSIFPETADQDVKEAFGLSVTIVTTSQNKEETKDFLQFLGLPFKDK